MKSSIWCIISVFLLVLDVEAQGQTDSLCRHQFISKLVADQKSYIVFHYIDSSGIRHLYGQSGIWFYHNLSKNRDLSVEEKQRVVYQKLFHDSAFMFAEFGTLTGVEVTKTKFYYKWRRRSKARFLKEITCRQNKSKIKDKYAYLKKPEVNLIAQELGIIIDIPEENDFVFYVSDCNAVRYEKVE